MNIKERLQRRSQRDKIRQLKKQKQAIPVTLSEIESKNLQDMKLTSFLKEYNILLDEEIHFYSTAKWIGDRFAKKIVINPEKRHYRKMIDIFKTGGGY